MLTSTQKQIAEQLCKEEKGKRKGGKGGGFGQRIEEKKVKQKCGALSEKSHACVGYFWGQQWQKRERM